MNNREIAYVETLILALGDLSQQTTGTDGATVAVANLAKLLGVNEDQLAAQCRVLDDRYRLVRTTMGSVTLMPNTLSILSTLRSRRDREKREREHQIKAKLFRLHKYGTEPNGSPFESFANIPLRAEYTSDEIEAAYQTLVNDGLVTKTGTVDVGDGRGRKPKFKVTDKGKSAADMPNELPPDPVDPPAAPEQPFTFDGWKE